MRKNLSPCKNSRSENDAKTTKTLPHLHPAMKTSPLQSVLGYLCVCRTKREGFHVLFFLIVHAEEAYFCDFWIKLGRKTPRCPDGFKQFVDAAVRSRA